MPTIDQIIAQRARPEIIRLTPYSSSAREAGQVPGVKLDANENPNAALVLNAADANRYPEPQPQALRARLAALYGQSADRLLIARGSDEIIDLLVRAFCPAGNSAVLVTPPCFSYYAVAACIQGAEVIEVPLADDFSIKKQAIIDAANKHDTNLVFLCSPMNPTGNVIDPQQVRDICQALPDRLIVLDEAYAEFSASPPLDKEIDRFPNLVCLRTLSKAYGLAGLRIGTMIAQASLVQLLAKIIAPYPLPRPCVASALQALSPTRMPIVSTRIAQILSERKRVADMLKSASQVEAVYPSNANFLLVKFNAVDEVFSQLLAAGIRVRNRDRDVPGTLRLTIGTESENNLLLAALGAIEPPAEGRVATVVRDTNETKIAVDLNLDRSGNIAINTGIGFYDHMLEQVARHGNFDLTLSCQGDLHIDDHHTIEDCAIALGHAMRQAVGDKRGIGRYGFILAMDEAQANVAVDLSGRAASVFEGQFAASHIGTYPTEMTSHVFASLAEGLRAAIHISVTGDNDHHMTEAAYKGLGRALRAAFARDGSDEMPSSKGVL